MTDLVYSVRSNLSAQGFHYAPGFDRNACLALAEALGTPVGEKRNPAVLRTIRPQPASAAPRNTLSSRYGMGTFPFHTDTAYWPAPARFILFHCVHSGSGNRPTLLIDPRQWRLTEQDRRTLCNEVWQTTTRQSFLCTLGTDCSEGLKMRFDEACMIPVTRGAFHVRDLVASLIQESPLTPINWKPEDILVLDNTRLLHARGAAQTVDEDRVLIRILIRE